MKRLAVFDGDGTLFDTMNTTLANFRRTSEILGFPSVSDEIMAKGLSTATGRGFADFIGLDGEQGALAIRTFYRISMETPDETSLPFPGIPRLLGELRSRGYLIAVASLMPQAMLDRLTARFGMGFDTAHGAVSGDETKADLIRLCLSDLGAGPEEAVMIGDTRNDEDAQREVGVAFVPVTYGYGFPSSSPGASDAGDILRMVVSLQRSDRRHIAWFPQVPPHRCSGAYGDGASAGIA